MGLGLEPVSRVGVGKPLGAVLGRVGELAGLDPRERPLRVLGGDLIAEHGALGRGRVDGLDLALELVGAERLTGRQPGRNYEDRQRQEGAPSAHQRFLEARRLTL